MLFRQGNLTTSVIFLVFYLLTILENFASLRIPRSDQMAVNGGAHPSDNMMHVMDQGDLKPLRCALIRLEGC